MSQFKDYYQFAHPTRVVAGRGMIEGVGFEFAKEGAKRPLIVTDGILLETGLVAKVEQGLADGALEPAAVFSEIAQDSSAVTVAACAEAAKEAGADSFLAVGGGSVMDTAKAANAVFTHGGSLLDYEGIYALPREDEGMGAPLAVAPLACIPTTAGTGSEVSFGAVIKDSERREKILIADFPLFPRLAILDPESTRTLPAALAAATGMDAMTHAIEGYTGPLWSPHGEAFALQALRMMRDNLPAAVEDPSNEEARGNMLVAASLAIVPGAGGTSGLGAAHSMSHPAGAMYGVPHGVANSINLPHVIRFNAAGGPEIADRYRDVAESLGAEAGGSDADVGGSLAGWVGELTTRMGLPQRLSEVGVPEEGIADLVEGAMGDGCSLTNARELVPEDFEELYRQAL
ncbi:MAG: iron-containing alcohol dehydrogenase [Solirubrobacterales bacterium]|nr:iron-containing alcohol dehydrogenase [Solirubrobacterales bacterium]